MFLENNHTTDVQTYTEYPLWVLPPRVCVVLPCVSVSGDVSPLPCRDEQSTASPDAVSDATGIRYSSRMQTGILNTSKGGRLWNYPIFVGKLSVNPKVGYFNGKLRKPHVEPLSAPFFVPRSMNRCCSWMNPRITWILNPLMLCATL